MLRNAYGYALERAVMPIGDRLAGGGFMQWLRRYRTEQWLPADQMVSLVHSRLASILGHARSNAPFYADMPGALDNPIEDLRQFPVLSKLDVKQHLADLLTQPKETLIAESGSGSSGIQSTVYMDKSGQASQRAMQMLWFEWCGYRMGDSILQTGITPARGLVKRTKDVLLNTKYIGAFDMSEETIESVLRDLRNEPRKYLFGYASSLFVLATAAQKLGFDNINFEHAVSWGDKLFSHYRSAIRDAFGCDTLDTYGCTEGAMIAAQCSEGSYHLSVNQCHVEILDDDDVPLPAGEMGNVVVTRLDNFAMPLIRYKLGDIAALEPPRDSDCRCGRQTPLLSNLIGRDTDIVATRTGKKMVVHFFTGIFEHVPEIRQFAVVQRSLDGIEIHYIPEPGFDKNTLVNIERTIHAHLDEDFPIKWTEVEHIAPTGSGKPQIIRSLLKNRDGGRGSTGSANGSAALF